LRKSSKPLRHEHFKRLTQKLGTAIAEGSLGLGTDHLNAAVIRHAVWLYYRFTLSYRDVEDLLAERGIDVSYESVRRWAMKFGPKIAASLMRRRPRPGSYRR
jgi:transposase-like protein